MESSYNHDDYDYNDEDDYNEMNGYISVPKYGSAFGGQQDMSYVLYVQYVYSYK